MDYQFYGWKDADVSAITDKYQNIKTPWDLYEALSDIWDRISSVARFMGC